MKYEIVIHIVEAGEQINFAILRTAKPCRQTAMWPDVPPRMRHRTSLSVDSGNKSQQLCVLWAKSVVSAIRNW